MLHVGHCVLNLNCVFCINQVISIYCAEPSRNYLFITNNNSFIAAKVCGGNHYIGGIINQNKLGSVSPHAHHITRRVKT